MEIKVKIELPEELSNALKALSGCSVKVETAANTNAEAPVKKTGRPRKAKEEPVAPAAPVTSDLEDEITEPSDDLPPADLEDFGDDFSDEEPTTLPEEKIAELKAALNKHAGKNSRAVTIAILHKYAKKSDDVKPGDFPKLMKELKV